MVNLVEDGRVLRSGNRHFGNNKKIELWLTVQNWTGGFDNQDGLEMVFGEDLDYAALGIARCLSHAKSGHEFLQHHIDPGRKGTTVDHFFKALSSGRRLANLTSLNAQISSVMNSKVEDPFARFKELKAFDFHAADGHYQKAARFDPKPTREGEAQVATGHFFRLNLRGDHLDHLDLSRPRDGKKKDHDMAVIKRTEVDRGRRSGNPALRSLRHCGGVMLDDEPLSVD